MTCNSCSTPAVGIARSEWQRHPHFPRQTLLLGSHENFRYISRYLIEQYEQGARDPIALRFLFERWIGAMRSHERYEEHKLYPFLQRRFEDDTQCLEVDHQRLHEAVDGVRAAFEGGQRDAANTVSGGGAPANQRDAANAVSGGGAPAKQRDAANAVSGGGAPANQRDAIVAALRAHDAVLIEHLDAEESLVIPRLLELEPAEFDAYYAGG